MKQYIILYNFYCGYSITYEKYRVMRHIVISMILYFNEYKNYKQLITENKPAHVEIKIEHSNVYNAF